MEKPINTFELIDIELLSRLTAIGAVGPLGAARRVCLRSGPGIW
jgi:hypothetical protein